MGDKLDNLIGRTFGQLEVIGRGENYIRKNGKIKTTWIVRCDCGKSPDFTVQRDVLIQKKRISCKICGYKRSGDKNSEDLTGKIFGQLLVIGLDDKKNNGRMWLVRCNCGRTPDYLASTSSLKSGRRNSCMKCGREKAGKTQREDLTGKQFGLLTVISFHEIKESKIYWWCQCRCDSKPISVYGGSLREGNSASCGCQKESYVASELKKYFRKNYMADIEHKMFRNYRTNYWLRCDIYLPMGEKPEINGVYIEVHGIQHYKFTPLWHKEYSKLNEQKKRDSLKKKFAKKNGIYIECDLRKKKTVEEWIEYILGEVKIE